MSNTFSDFLAVQMDPIVLFGALEWFGFSWFTHGFDSYKTRSKQIPFPLKRWLREVQGFTTFQSILSYPQMLLLNPGCNQRYLGSKDRDFLELFAGQGEVTKALRHVAWLSLPPLCPNSPACCSHMHGSCEADLRGTAMDVDHHPAFDLTTPSGFVSLGGADL